MSLIISQSKPVFSTDNAMGLQTFFLGDQFVILPDWKACCYEAQVIRTEAKSLAKSNYRRSTKIKNRSFRYKLIPSRCKFVHVLGLKKEEYSPKMVFLFNYKLYLK